MNRGYVVRHARPMAWLCGIALLAIATFANAASVSFGARTLQIPTPEQDKPIAAAFPGMIGIASGYLPTSNRLVEMYVTPGQFKEIENAGHPQLDHYFQLQVPRTLEGIHISAEQFSQGRSGIKAGIEKASSQMQTVANGLAHNGNQNLHELTGSNVNVTMSNTGKFGIFREEPWGLFFSMQTSVSITGHAPMPEVISGAIVCIDGQVIGLYSISHGVTKADIAWTQQSLDAWADAIHAANPA